MLSVVIPTIGRSASLREAVHHLHRQTAEATAFEIIVVADANEAKPEALADVASGSDVTTRVIQAADPGASAARNAGVAASNGTVILFLDDDVLPDPVLVEAHLDAHAAHPEPELGVLGHVRWADRLRVSAFMRWVDRGIQFDYAGITGNRAGWGQFYTANASVKREMLERVGGFDAVRFPFGYEDLDLALRMSHAGFELLFEPRASAQHLHPMTLDFWRVRVRRVAAAERQFCAVHPEIEPHFHRVFSKAMIAPRASGRGRALLRWVDSATPLVGRRAWISADLYYRQQLAPHFFEAWEAADDEGSAVQPDLAERERSSSGSPPSGPK